VVKHLAHKPKSLPASIVSGSVVLLAGSILTVATNLVYNIVVARFLGTKGFGQATVVYTLLLLLSAVTLSFQIVSSKVVAQQGTFEGKTAVYRGFHHAAWVCGLLVALLLILFQGAISRYLNLPDPFLVALMAVGAAFYVPLGPRRGYIQGTCGFRGLATNLILEGAIRLGGSYCLILVGLGVRGVIAANAAATAVAYLAISPKLAAHGPNPLSLADAFRETAQAVIFYSGQMLIGNCGIVTVNHFFNAHLAGLYAAVAMVGRVILTMTSAVVNTTFPLVAGTSHENRRDLKVISTSLLLVLVSGAGLALALCIEPSWVWTKLFGPTFQIPGRYDMSYLLALYAIAIVIYSLSAVIITFEMSYKIANATWVQLVFSALLIAGIYRFHSSLREVIAVQLVLMTALLVAVAIPFMVSFLGEDKDVLLAGGCQPVRLVRSISEDEVIAEFLKSDFENQAFRRYRETLKQIVTAPDLSDHGENAKRRALLFLRHLTLWREIPAGTEWYEVEVNEDDLESIRAFPRAQWRKLARGGNFAITEIAARLKSERHGLDVPFLAKIDSLCDHLLRDETKRTAVIMIGVSENEPLTVLDGNHRLTAAMLGSPRTFAKLKFLCGFSPRMRECCWYNTNLGTLFRYGRNRMGVALRDPEAELMRLLHQPETL
jgi:O-antigen/teichoic acid export membrane protein